MIPYSRPKRSDHIPYPRVNCLKTIPYTAAHTYLAHIWQYPPPGTQGKPLSILISHNASKFVLLRVYSLKVIRPKIWAKNCLRMDPLLVDVCVAQNVFA